MYEYIIESEKAKEIRNEINDKKFFMCKMRSRLVNKNIVKVYQLEGNCVDVLDDILDKFGGHYILNYK